VLWPGDQQTDWSDGDGLPSVIPMGIGLGLTGFPYFGGDIGGYMSEGTTPTTEELWYRWASFGALQPVMRTHHGRSATENFQWEHDDASVAHFRRWTRLHMQLAAYQWGSIGSYERDGMPLMRLIALEYPDEDWAWSQLDEYLLGDRILVAPVQTQGATSRSVQLPAGTWYPLLGGASVSGMISAPAAMTEIPAFVPSGSILVLYPDGISSVWTTKPGADREVWLFAGHGNLGTWNDETGPIGTPQWTWSGRTDGAITTATWNGAPIAIANGTVSVTGDGTLAVGDGTLVIARGIPTANVLVRM
jgi:alpha-glucosidase (family GH31 glycosyl hydrolase)